jgi:hypothetical protein
VCYILISYPIVFTAVAACLHCSYAAMLIFRLPCLLGNCWSQVDYGFSGEVRRVEVDRIMDRLIAGDVVHLTCLGFSPSGQVFNVDTEDLARVCAIKVCYAAKHVSTFACTACENAHD